MFFTSLPVDLWVEDFPRYDGARWPVDSLPQLLGVQLLGAQLLSVQVLAQIGVGVILIRRARREWKKLYWETVDEEIGGRE